MAINMSYCRWHNTYLALKECFESGTEKLSDEEERAREKIFNLFIRTIYYAPMDVSDIDYEEWLEMNNLSENEEE